MSKLMGLFVIVLMVAGMFHFFPSSLEVAKAQLLSTQLDCSTLFLIGAVYAVLLCIPFVPGAEIGLLLMILFGREGIVIVYLYTILGLNGAFILGRHLPLWQTRIWLNKLGKFCKESPETPQLPAYLARLKDCLPQSPYVWLGMLFNLPGNSVLGGGGGIAFLSGMNRQLSWKGFACTVVVATSPIPLFAFLGLIQLESWI